MGKSHLANHAGKTGSTHGRFRELSKTRLCFDSLCDRARD